MNEKATEGTTYKDPSFTTHTTSARNVSLITGAYHFAHPYPNTNTNTTHPHSGKEQANYFLAHGGGWMSDGYTLPGMLDLENNPSKEGDKCYNLSPGQMVGWIREFVDVYKAATGRAPMLYTTAEWWGRCTGDSQVFSGGGEDGGSGEGVPLVLARYNEVPGQVPGGWEGYAFWQNSNRYVFGGDSEVWKGSEEKLRGFAKGG